MAKRVRAQVMRRLALFLCFSDRVIDATPSRGPHRAIERFARITCSHCRLSNEPHVVSGWRCVLEAVLEAPLERCTYGFAPQARVATGRSTKQNPQSVELLLSPDQADEHEMGTRARPPCSNRALVQGHGTRAWDMCADVDQILCQGL